MALDGGKTSSEPIPPPKPAKAMSKAERRELQEKQRAAKALSQGKTPAPTASTKPPTKPQAKDGPSSSTTNPKAVVTARVVSGHPRAESSKMPDQRSSGSGAGGAGTSESVARELGIFSHFGLPKQATSGHKGDIHPAIVRLGLQFASFKITGANARCIATLMAFKSV